MARDINSLPLTEQAGYWLTHTQLLAFICLILMLALTSCYLLWRIRRIRHHAQGEIHRLSESAESFRYLVEHAHEGIVVVQDKRLVYFNPRMCEMTGYTEAELKALPSFLPLIHPSVRDVMMANHLRRLHGDAAPQRYESLFLHKDGSSYPIELSGVAIRWSGQPATLNMLTDISKRKAAERELKHLAHHDCLTGLPNRLTLLERLDKALALSDRTGTPLAVIFIDLNGFKQVNDTYGHAVGDGLLQGVSARLNPLCREADTLARMGGDEFVLLMTQVENTAGVEQGRMRIAAAMQAPF